jgi:hypothetical protein
VRTFKSALFFVGIRQGYARIFVYLRFQLTGAFRTLTGAGEVFKPRSFYQEFRVESFSVLV